ncbi:hypothetical protein MHYP_G00201670 [Metynnis hypsauchen]
MLAPEAQQGCHSTVQTPAADPLLAVNSKAKLWPRGGNRPLILHCRSSRSYQRCVAEASPKLEPCPLSCPFGPRTCGQLSLKHTHKTRTSTPKADISAQAQPCSMNFKRIKLILTTTRIRADRTPSALVFPNEEKLSLVQEILSGWFCISSFPVAGLMLCGSSKEAFVKPAYTEQTTDQDVCEAVSAGAVAVGSCSDDVDQHFPAFQSAVGRSG